MKFHQKTLRKQPFILQHDLEAVKPIAIKCKVIAAIEPTLPSIQAAYLLQVVVIYTPDSLSTY